MGIESVSGVSSYQAAGNMNVAKTVKPAETVDAVSAAANLTTGQTNIGQVAAVSEMSQQNTNNEAGKDKGDSKGKEPTMKDVKEINKIINNNTIAEFGYNEPTKRITIKIKDKDTDEVIKEIPSEKALEMLAKAWELAGILVDEKR